MGHGDLVPQPVIEPEWALCIGNEESLDHRGSPLDFLWGRAGLTPFQIFTVIYNPIKQSA